MFRTTHQFDHILTRLWHVGTQMFPKVDTVLTIRAEREFPILRGEPTFPTGVVDSKVSKPVLWTTQPLSQLAKRGKIVRDYAWQWASSLREEVLGTMRPAHRNNRVPKVRLSDCTRDDLVNRWWCKAVVKRGDGAIEPNSGLYRC